MTNGHHVLPMIQGEDICGHRCPALVKYIPPPTVFTCTPHTLTSDAEAVPCLTGCADSIVIHRPPIRVLPCDHAITNSVGGYCVCGGSMAVPALPALAYRATCEWLCAAAPATQAIPIPSSSSCPSGVHSCWNFDGSYLPYRGACASSSVRSATPPHLLHHHNGKEHCTR